MFSKHRGWPVLQTPQWFVTFLALTHAQLSWRRLEAQQSLLIFPSFLNHLQLEWTQSRQKQTTFLTITNRKMGFDAEKEFSQEWKWGRLPAEDKGTEFQNTVSGHQNVDYQPVPNSLFLWRSQVILALRVMTLHCKMGWILSSSFISTQPKTRLPFQILKILKNQIICLLLKCRHQRDIARCILGLLNGLCTIHIPFWRINNPNMGFTWHPYRTSEWYLSTGEVQAGF